MNKFIILTLSTLTALSIHNEPLPHAEVTIVEDEIEIEYVDTTIWNNWIFDTDTSIEYMFFDNETNEITYIRPPSEEELERARVIGDMSEEEVIAMIETLEQ
tara:strand:- start:36 stop:341 length:306 start_codon:yes stop_codon:yes gene_type:complete